MDSEPSVMPWARVVILLLALAVARGLSYYATGSVIPLTSTDGLIFQSTLLFVGLGSTTRTEHDCRGGHSRGLSI